MKTINIPTSLTDLGININLADNERLNTTKQQAAKITKKSRKRMAKGLKKLSKLIGGKA